MDPVLEIDTELNLGRQAKRAATDWSPPVAPAGSNVRSPVRECRLEVQIESYQLEGRNHTLHISSMLAVKLPAEHRPFAPNYA